MCLHMDYFEKPDGAGISRDGLDNISVKEQFGRPEIFVLSNLKRSNDCTA